MGANDCMFGLSELMVRVAGAGKVVVQVLLVSAGALWLSGCGANSDSEATLSPTRSVAGVVEDGPIAGARVFLYSKIGNDVVRFCGPRGSGRCETITDDQGRFSFDVNEGASLADLVVVALGGSDSETGMEFGSMEMRAPLALFPDAPQVVSVNPITTLCAHRLAQYLTLEQAEDQVRSWLGLDSAIPLSARPGQSLDLLRRTLLLTKLAMEKKKQGEADPFAALAGQMGSSYLLDDSGDLNPGTLAYLGFDDPVRKSIDRLYAALRQSDSRGLIATFKRTEVAEAVSAFFARMLQDGDSFEPDNEAFQRNLDLLADQALAAAGGTIPLGGLIPQRVARYVLNYYGPDGPWDWAAFTADRETFAALLVHEESGLPLRNDSYVAELAAITAPLVTALPLLQGEIPGDDNLKRLAYYYNSDASHLYRAEKLIGTVFDDMVNDQVMLQVVRGKAQSGLLDEARAMVETQMFQSEYRAHGYRELGQSLTAYGRGEDALVVLGKAEELYRRVVAAKGEQSFANSDSDNFKNLARAYYRAGEPAAALAVARYLADQIAPYQSSAIVYGRTFSAAMEVADAYLAEGDLVAAAPVIDLMAEMADATPPHIVGGSETHRYRVLNWVETAERYAGLGEPGRVWEIWLKIQALRTNDGLPANRSGSDTIIYMDEMALVLYRAGFHEEAFALVNSLPAGPTELDRSMALKKLATQMALDNGLGVEHSQEPGGFAGFSALDMVRYKMIADRFNTIIAESQIEALTYYNKTNAFIAKSLIDAGRAAEARAALERALVLVESLDDNQEKPYLGSSKVTHGYAKMAGLYKELGDFAIAADLLETAEGIIPALVDPNVRNKAVVAVADAWMSLGDYERMAALLSQIGQSIAIADYREIIEAFLDLGNQARAYELAVEYGAQAARILTPLTPEADREKQAKTEVRHLLLAAGFLAATGAADEAVGVLAVARETAGQIFVTAERMDKLVAVAGGYAQARDFAAALDLATALPYVNDRNRAIQAVAEAFALRDDFPDTWVASVDTDHDGRPDFIHPLATPAEIENSGLLAEGTLLDDDSDGDGLPDRDDFRPLYRD